MAAYPRRWARLVPPRSEYLNIISFVLQANGIKPDGKALTPASAKKIKLSGE